jgi:hypothetical protein
MDEASSLLGNNTSAAISESPLTHQKSSSTMSLITVNSKAKSAEPELTWSLRRHQRELSQLENESKEIRAKSDEDRGHHAADSKHDKAHTNTRPTTSPANATCDSQVYQTRQPEVSKQGDAQNHPLPASEESNNVKRLTMKVVDHAPNELNNPGSGLDSYRFFDRSILTELAREGYPHSPSPAKQSDMHECIWRRLFLEEQRREFENEERRVKEGGVSVMAGAKDKGSRRSGSEKKDLGFKGLTLVVHREGGEDLVLVCDL